MSHYEGDQCPSITFPEPQACVLPVGVCVCDKFHTW